MPKVDVNKKRNDPNAQIDLQTFWNEIDNIKDQKVTNFTGDWNEDFGHVRSRFQDPNNDTIIPLGRLEDGKYGLINLSINLNLLAAGSALSGLGVFRRAALAHLTTTRTPEQLKIVIIDPIRALEDFNDIAHLAIPRAVTRGEVNTTLQWLQDEYERRIQIVEDTGNLMYTNNEKSDDKQPKLLVLITELGEIGIENEKVQGVLMRYMQMSRAIEMNSIICTQQFSEESLLDSILSNCFVKLAFKLPYKKDSVRIISKAGAEELLGQGDMIFTNEVDYWRMQGFHF